MRVYAPSWCAIIANPFHRARRMQCCALHINLIHGSSLAIYEDLPQACHSPSVASHSRMMSEACSPASCQLWAAFQPPNNRQ